MFGKPRVGDLLEVTDGPYVGKTGTLVAIGETGAFTVFIDECCQPTLRPDQVLRRRRAWGRAKAADPGQEAEVRSQAVGQHPGNGLGGSAAS